MRMFAQDGAFYRRIRVDETEDAEARDRLSILEGIDAMRERFSAAEACRAFGVSRATYYEWRKRLKAGGVSGLVRPSSRPLRHPGRQWTMDDAALALGARREMPWAGKARVAVEAARRRPERSLSTATEGRILAWGVETGRARPCSFCEGRVRGARRRDFGDGGYDGAPTPQVQCQRSTVANPNSVSKPDRRRVGRSRWLPRLCHQVLHTQQL